MPVLHIHTDENGENYVDGVDGVDADADARIVARYGGIENDDKCHDLD